MKKLDWYILKKFLGTFFFAIMLLMAIAVVLDYTEKMDSFAESEAPKLQIVIYYLTFIPFMSNMLAPLITFVACIFFTSKLAGDSEVIAMLAAGVSFNRLLRPYMLGALIIGLLTVGLNSFVIPWTSVSRLEFLTKYYKDRDAKVQRNNQFMVGEGRVAFFYTFDRTTLMGYRFALEQFDGTEMQSRLTAEQAHYEGDYKWHLTNYNIRTLTPYGEELQSGAEMDTIVNVKPNDIIIGEKDMEKMTSIDLNQYIQDQKDRGIAGGIITRYEIELQKRFAALATAFILTFLGVCLSSKKIRGGMGVNLGIGLALCFIYILLQTITSSFAASGSMSVMMAVWLPNIIYLPLCWYLYKYKAPR